MFVPVAKKFPIRAFGARWSPLGFYWVLAKFAPILYVIVTLVKNSIIMQTSDARLWVQVMGQIGQHL